MSIKSKLLAAFAALSLACSAHALSFNLWTADATNSAGNPGDSAFADIRADGTVLGDMGGIFTAGIGGDADSGFSVTVYFNGAQPELDSAFLKAGNRYLWWDSADLAAFNAGSYDSITLWNSGPNGITNQNGKYQATSHAGLNGTPGTQVPDGGMTVGLIGLALAGLASARRFARR